MTNKMGGKMMMSEDEMSKMGQKDMMNKSPHTHNTMPMQVMRANETRKLADKHRKKK